RERVHGAVRGLRDRVRVAAPAEGAQVKDLSENRDFPHGMLELEAPDLAPGPLLGIGPMKLRKMFDRRLERARDLLAPSVREPPRGPFANQPDQPPLAPEAEHRRVDQALESAASQQQIRRARGLGAHRALDQLVKEDFEYRCRPRLLRND